MVQIGIAFAPGSATDAVNIRRVDHTRVYYLDMVAVFACARRWNSDAELFLGTTRPPPADVLGDLTRLGVDIEIVPFAHEPPPGISNTFAASLYLLDILDMPRCRRGVLIIDPDCTIVRGIPTLSETAIGAHVLQFTATTMVNGLSEIQAHELHAEFLGNKMLTPFRHIGGEMLWVPRGLVGSLLDELAAALEYSISRHMRGESTWFSTEEHLLGAAARTLPFEDLEFVRRIWTARSYRDATRADLNLVVWHLPAEKERGLLALRNATDDREGWFWTDDTNDWISRASRILGIVPNLRRRVEIQIGQRLRRPN